jgi:Ni/Co efflux regulator RcnB
MNIRKILTAAAAAAVLSVAGAPAASADNYDRDGSRYDRDYRDNDRDTHRGWDRHSGWRHDHRHFADRDTIFRSLRYHRIHYSGEPYFVRGHYVVRSFDRFGRVSFIEINPYTGGVIGVIRL